MGPVNQKLPWKPRLYSALVILQGTGHGLKSFLEEKSYTKALTSLHICLGLCEKYQNLVQAQKVFWFPFMGEAIKALAG